MTKYAAAALVLLASLTSAARAGGKSDTDEIAFQYLYLAWQYSSAAQQGGEAGTASALSNANYYTFWAAVAAYYSSINDEIGTPQADDDSITYAELCKNLINQAFPYVISAYFGSTNPAVTQDILFNYLGLYYAQIYITERSLGR